MGRSRGFSVSSPSSGNDRKMMLPPQAKATIKAEPATQKEGQAAARSHTYPHGNGAHHTHTSGQASGTGNSFMSASQRQQNGHSNTSPLQVQMMNHWHAHNTTLIQFLVFLGSKYRILEVLPHIIQNQLLHLLSQSLSPCCSTHSPWIPRTTKSMWAPTHQNQDESGLSDTWRNENDEFGQRKSNTMSER